MGNPHKDRWATRIGLILAMAGNAVGLGNFLRFPTQAAQNGGGAFMIPYFISFLLLGIPLMWVEWAIGRRGGIHGHGSLPGGFYTLWKHPAARYLGVFSILITLATVIFYLYVESWTLAFSIFSINKSYFGIQTREGMGAFLHAFQGVEKNQHFAGIGVALLFFLVTLVINVWILRRGISKGIEILAKIAMPLLFIMAVVLVIRVFTLGTPDPAYPDRSVWGGFAFVWNPNFSALSSPTVWLAAAGQIFFTLSLGAGHLHCYASYLREKDDIALTGLTTSATNEFVEVVLGGSLAIPIAFAFFGFQETVAIANSGSYNLAFQALPIVFQKMYGGWFFGFLWFLLLFFAGITSSVALSSPTMSFLQDELGMTRNKAAWVVGAIILTGGLLVALFLGYGFLDEMDFWVGTFFLVVLAFIEVVLFAWVLGMDKAWKEIHKGADMRVPIVFKYIIKYVTPVFLGVLLMVWFVKDGIPYLAMSHVDAGNTGEILGRWGARVLMISIFILFVILTRKAFGRKGRD